MTCSIHLATYNLCHSALKRFACAHHVLPHRQIDFQSRTRQGFLIWPGVCAACYKYLDDCVIARQAPSNIFMSPGFELGYIALDSMHLWGPWRLPGCRGRPAVVRNQQQGFPQVTCSGGDILERAAQGFLQSPSTSLRHQLDRQHAERPSWELSNSEVQGC